MTFPVEQKLSNKKSLFEDSPTVGNNLAPLNFSGATQSLSMRAEIAKAKTAVKMPRKMYMTDEEVDVSDQSVGHDKSMDATLTKSKIPYQPSRAAVGLDLRNARPILNPGAHAKNKSVAANKMSQMTLKSMCEDDLASISEKQSELTTD